MATKKDNHGSLPDHVLNQIFEFTAGGFIIFYFNQETGQPEQAASFDSPAHVLALQKHIADWQKAVDQISLDNSINTIHEDYPEDDEEE